MFVKGSGITLRLAPTMKSRHHLIEDPTVWGWKGDL